MTKPPQTRWRNEGIVPGFQVVGISRRLEGHDPTLCLVEVSPQNAASYHCVPTPRDAIAQLLRHADIKLPKAFALSGTHVSTKKKLQSERLVL